MASLHCTVTVTTEHVWRAWSLRRAARWFRLMRGKPFVYRTVAAIYLGALKVRVSH